jgi:tRNA (guanine37-N1)-methyltransferase
VLLSGNHAEIARWREAEARKRTAERRPDLAAGMPAPEAEPAARGAVAQATGPRRAKAGRA